MDTHTLPHLQDPLAMERINVRCRAASPDLTAAFHTFDASRYAWLAVQLRSAGLDEIARLADDWSDEHRQTAAKLSEAA
jgi:hypothetical protein